MTYWLFEHWRNKVLWRGNEFIKLSFWISESQNKGSTRKEKKKKVQLVSPTLAIKYWAQKFISLLYDCIKGSKKFQI